MRQWLPGSGALVQSRISLWCRRRTPELSGSAFAEDPGRPAPEARLLWHADLDPFVLEVRVSPTAATDPDGIDLARLLRWATIVRGGDREHVALSDGWHRIRLDVVGGSLVEEGPARLDYLLSGMTRVDAHVLTLRRMLDLWRTGRFSPKLHPPEPGMGRRIEALRVGDAVAAGATYREMATALYGADLVRDEWKGRSDFLLSRVRRRADEAVRMAAGGWRTLLGTGAGSRNDRVSGAR
ncbi:DNA -binding domain-containing protein [Sphingomonas sp. TDK1]|uniref:DNA -binding domain-containing protein n=1 Tax=Sphingomonas sp. TDK1 TaxID=453247 RepID=UPI0007D91B0B|nr:DUF2285 domain-containing protein [Sphingomonas sp. TDK1]OAN62657.1 hypothetical protein A7X12_21930 [Sphingomonas sp. TDK1]